MYFHPADYRSDVVNTDRIGFRVSRNGTDHASPGGRLPDGPVNLVVGSSAVFGVGATHDGATLPSLLWSRYAPSRPWLNFGGRSHNSTQELLLFLLYRHLLPPVEQVVVYSGFNNLGLARLPRSKQGDHGAFFLCDDYFAKMDELRQPPGKSGRRRRRAAAAREAADEAVPDVDEQIDRAAELTVRHLGSWRLLTQALGARLSFVLQPLAPWVRDQPCREETLLFRELDELFNFGQMYGDITPPEVGRRYAAALRAGCDELDVPFLDMNVVLADALAPQDWTFVDRCHLTDQGHDTVARLLAEHLSLK
jgi:hypothetical protein